MKRFCIYILYLTILQNICFSQSWQVIFDTTRYGISKFNSFNINSGSHKLIFFRLGINYNPNKSLINESGRYLRFNQLTNEFYVPFNNFLNPFWSTGSTAYCYPVRELAISPVDTNIIIKNVIYVYFDPDEFIRMTTNGGINYFNIPLEVYSSGGGCSGFDFNPVSPDEVFVGHIWFSESQYRRGAFKNIFSFQSWEITDTIPELKPVTAGGFFKVNPFSSQNVFAVGNKMLLSTQGGYNFFQLNVPQFKTMLFDPVDSTIFGFRKGKLYKSYKNGTVWDSLSINFNPNCAEISPDNHYILYAGSDTGLFRSTNHGIDWYLYNNSFSYSKKVIGVSKDRFTADTVIVCTDKALYKVWASEIVSGIEKIKNIIPESYSLSQNYPNPFNPATNIKFQTAKLGEVKLIILDVLGRENATLVDQQLQPGTYEAEWDGTNYSSGVYFYKLITPEYTETRKMVLVK